MNDTVYSIDEIQRRIHPVAMRHNVDKIYLFGSYARGEATGGSDIDLCVDAPRLKGLFALGGLYAALEDALGKPLDLITVNSLKYNPDPQFIRELEKDRVLVYEYVQ